MFSGTNLPRVGSYNVNVVLSAVQASEGISRVEIAKQTGLTAQTVSVIVRRLIQQGIVEEGGSLPSKGGKPRTTLRINPTAAYAVGIHFDPLGRVHGGRRHDGPGAGALAPGDLARPRPRDVDRSGR